MTTLRLRIPQKRRDTKRCNSKEVLEFVGAHPLHSIYFLVLLSYLIGLSSVLE